MDIVVGDVNSVIKTTDRRVLALLRKVCRARPSGYAFMPKYKSGHWDGYISLMAALDSVPTGLLGFVVAALREKGYDISIDWGDASYDKLQSLEPNCLNGMVARDYQLDAAQKLLNAGRGIAKMATNSGKTLTIALLIYAIGGAHLVIVPSKDLLYQTSNDLSKLLDVEVGLIGDGKFTKQTVTVAIINSLRNIKKLYDEFSDNVGLFIDECHHSSAERYLEVISSIPGRWRFGFSGTPLKRNALADMRLMALTGRVVCEITNRQMIARGYSATPKIIMYDVYSEDNSDWKLPYSDAYKKLIVDNGDRNALIAKIASQQSGVVLVIVSRIVHGLALRGMIADAVFVNGSDSAEYRQHVLEQMRTVPGIYIATNIFDEGVDVPAISNLIMAAGGKAERLVLQRVGRGLREKDGENILHVHDFIDDTNRYLLQHSEARLDVYIAEGFEIAAAIGFVV